MSETTLTLEQIKRAIESERFFPVELSAEERKPLSGVKDVGEVGFSLLCDLRYDRELPPVVKMRVEATLTLIDDHTFKAEKKKFSDCEEVVLFSSCHEDEVERQGNNIDLRPTFLAVLYSLVPISYSKVKLKRVETADAVILSEDEYWRDHPVNDDSNNSR